MSVSEKSIQAFIKVLESESELLSNQDWADLEQLVGNLPEDSEEISAAIQTWLQLESRSQIREAYKTQRKGLVSSSSIDLNKNLGPGNTKSPTPPNQPSPSSRELLDNAIKKNSSSSDSSASKQKP